MHDIYPHPVMPVVRFVLVLPILVIVPPMMVPAVVVGVGVYIFFTQFAFATSFDEVVITLFVAGPNQSTLPRQMFTGIRENISPTIAALATILIIFSTCLLLVLEWLRGRNKAAAKF